jgi:hypothetical protein
MKPPFRFIGAETSADTIEVLKQLLDAAKKGELIGLAFAAMYRRRAYAVGYTGECARNPTFARGMVDDLHDDMGQRTNHTTDR